MSRSDQAFATRPDPNQIFKTIAEIISDREGVKVTLKSVSRNEQKEKTA